MYTSTRNKLNINASEAIIKGISEDGGLFIFRKLNHFSMHKNFAKYNYKDFSKIILQFFLNDFTDAEIDEIVEKSYSSDNFEEKILDIKNFNDIGFLELYYGPTMAFKDMALTMLPNIIKIAKQKNDKNLKTLILTATSGDTGGAALAGFRKMADNKIIVLYPEKGISNFQESQMHFFKDDNAKVIAIDGNFDDCQNLVKQIFLDMKNLKNFELTSANSINIGRLIPQIIYYFYSYFLLVDKKEISYGDKINFVVPTGNFGNILACYIAKQMGLFIDKIVCASNENNVLTDFFRTNMYDCNRPFHLTNSPAMDILISSNLERLLYMITSGNDKLVGSLMKDLKEKKQFFLPSAYHDKLKEFLAYSIDNDETIHNIAECFKKYKYIIDPHTAVAYGAYLKLKNKLIGKTIIVSTASPYKFVETVNEALQIEKEGFSLIEEISKIGNIKIPKSLEKIYTSTFDKEVYNRLEMEEKMKKIIGEIDENY